MRSQIKHQGGVLSGRKRSLWKLEDLSFVTVKGTPDRLKRTPIYNAAFDFWQREWSKIFAKIDPGFETKEESFHNQTRISLLLHNGKIVALQSLTHHNLNFNELLNTSYFSDYRIEFFQNLQKRKITTFQSMQHYIVGEGFGPFQTGQNIAAILAGLGFLQQIKNNLDATITLARKDNASYTTSLKFGMLQVGTDITMHNVPVGQMITEGALPYPNDKVQNAINLLWEKHEKSDEYKEGVTKNVYRENIL